MNRLRSSMSLLLGLFLVFWVSPIVSNEKDCAIVEFLNNSDKTIFVDHNPVAPNQVISIPFSGVAQKCICTIKEHGSMQRPRRYRIVHVGNNDFKANTFSPIKIDFQTIRFVALADKKQPGYDEISVCNDMPYDISVSFVHKDRKNNDGNNMRGKITIEPGKTFHKSVYCALAKPGHNERKTLGHLFISVMNLVNGKKRYSVFYPRRIYTNASLVGAAGWKSGTISAQTLKLFNECFTVSCT